MSRRHKVGGEASPVTTRHEWNAMGSSDDGQKFGKELSLEQALRERHLPGAIRMYRSLERVRLHVSVIDHFNGLRFDCANCTNALLLS